MPYGIAFSSVIRIEKVSVNLVLFGLLNLEGTMQFIFLQFALTGFGFLSPFTSTEIMQGVFVVLFGLLLSPKLPQPPHFVNDLYGLSEPTQGIMSLSYNLNWYNEP